MSDEKHSVEMTDQKKIPHHLSTIAGDVTLENLVIEDRERKEKALVRKVDIRMMPLMMLLCTLPLRRSSGLLLTFRLRYFKLP